MNLLLDECVDQRLAREIHGHKVKTVPALLGALPTAPKGEVTNIRM